MTTCVEQRGWNPWLGIAKQALAPAGRQSPSPFPGSRSPLGASFPVVSPLANHGRRSAAFASAVPHLRRALAKFSATEASSVGKLPAHEPPCSVQAVIHTRQAHPPRVGYHCGIGDHAVLVRPRRRAESPSHPTLPGLTLEPSSAAPGSEPHTTRSQQP